MGLFSNPFDNSKALVQALASATFIDVFQAFKEFSRQHSDDRINGFALCTVEDAATPYIMGTTLEDSFGPVAQDLEVYEDGYPYGFNSYPADWCWSYKGAVGNIDKAIGEIRRAKFSAEKQANLTFQGLVDGLKKFDAGGHFKGRLPRNQMVQFLWIHDFEDTEQHKQWAKSVNPAPVANWIEHAWI